MSLEAGTRLGPYEVVSLLGSGGMGSVYRARDLRLGRDVALKVMAPRPDGQRLARFEREARALSALSHPHVLSVFDVGSQDGRPYLVTELLEGPTLRERLAEGALPLRKALEYARQIAQGLAAAHDRGIIHRDLKPENIVISRAGHVKILDFGLARLTTEDEPRPSFDPDAAATEDELTAGRVLGTTGYMAPEQVRGEALDARCDIFSFGVVLHEMVTGKRAFRGPTMVETLNAILKDDPPLLRDSNPGVPPAVVRVIAHCLEKSPAERFQSTRDLAFELQGLGDLTSGAIAPAGRPRLLSRRRVVGAGVVLAAAAGGVALYTLLAPAPVPAVPTITRLTFRRGTIESARFAPDGETVVYGAHWDGAPPEIFSARLGSPESRSLGFEGAEILALSSRGEMAISLHRRRLGTFVAAGTLAEAPLAGGAPRDRQEDVLEADWTPEGGALSIVDRRDGRSRLTKPGGRVLYETAGWLSHHRHAPSGGLIAFIDHPVWGDDGGNIAAVDSEGKARILSRGWSSVQGLAWSARGDEVWFTGTRDGSGRALHAVSLDGRERAVTRMAGTLLLHDVHRSGRVLLSHQVLRREIRGLTAGTAEERDLSWLDYSFPADISDDGSTLFFAENAEGGGSGYSAYLRRTDGAAAVRLGRGAALALSPDGLHVLVGEDYTSDAQRLMLIPTGAGEARALPASDVRTYAASFFPDGKAVLLAGNEPGKATRTYRQALDGGAPQPVSGAAFALTARPISPDGGRLALRTADGRHEIVSSAGGEPRPLPGAAADDQVIRWSSDGRYIFIYKPGARPARVERLDVATGRREPWRQLRPVDGAGVVAVTPVLLSADARSYVYGYRRVLSDLYAVHGLR